MTPRYPGLAQIADPVVRQAFKLLHDQIGRLQVQAGGIGTVTQPLTAAMDAGGNRVQSLADPEADGDAVSLQYLKRYVEGALAHQAETDQAAAEAAEDLPGGGDGGEAQAGVTEALPTGDIGGSGTTARRFGELVGGTANEYPALTAIVADQPTRDANRLELLLRTIWHAAQAGFTVGRQQNPSGALSGDKIAVVVDDGHGGTVTRAYDCYSGMYTTPMVIQALEVAPAHLVADPGTPD